MADILALLQSPDAWISLLTLTFLEIVLGIDNIIFISIVTNKLPVEQQPKARKLGLLLALLFRIGLLMGISIIISFKDPLFTLLDYAVSGRDLILIIGGLFLLAKSTSEIHHKVEGGEEEESDGTKATKSFMGIIVQIIILDLVFSFDSILTAVGLTDHIEIMIAAVIISMMIMMAFSTLISNFINQHPTLQILALAFLILIGVMLIAEGLGAHVPKGYIYFSVAFSLLVEIVNMRMRKKKVKE